MDNINNNKPKPKYHYVQVVGNWDNVKNYVNNEGYEIWQMCPLHTNECNTLVYLLRKELDCDIKDI